MGQQPPGAIDASDNSPIKISYASRNDCVELAYIHAGVSIADRLACCMIKRPESSAFRFEAALFEYEEALKNNPETIVLKATVKSTGKIVGGAWMQLFRFDDYEQIKIPLRKLGSEIPDCMNKKLYAYVHKMVYLKRAQDHKSRYGLEEDYSPQCCKYHPSTNCCNHPQGFVIDMSQ